MQELSDKWRGCLLFGVGRITAGEMSGGYFVTFKPLVLLVVLSIRKLGFLLRRTA